MKQHTEKNYTKTAVKHSIIRV